MMNIFAGTNNDDNTDAVIYITDDTGETHMSHVHSDVPFTALSMATAARVAARPFSGAFPRIHPLSTPGRITLASASYNS